MGKVAHSIFNGAFAVVKMPLFIVILIAMVLSVTRHPRGTLAHARLPKQNF